MCYLHSRIDKEVRMSTNALVRNETSEGAIANIGDDDQLIQMWLLEKRSQESRRAYHRDIQTFRCFTKKGLKKVKFNDLQGFATAIADKYSDASQKRMLAAVKSLLTFGHKLGYLPYNVGLVLKNTPEPKNTLAERILEQDEVIRMIALESNSTHRLILKTLYSTGARVSELCGLKWRDLKRNCDRGQITIQGKGSKTRIIAIPSNLMAELVKHRDTNKLGTDDPIFPSSTGAHLHTNQIRRIVTYAARNAGIEGNVSPHWLRHCHASHSLERGASVQLVKDTLGHSNLMTTQKYLHARPSDSSALYLAI